MIKKLLWIASLFLHVSLIPMYSPRSIVTTQEIDAIRLSVMCCMHLSHRIERQNSYYKNCFARLNSCKESVNDVFSSCCFLIDSDLKTNDTHE